MPYLSLLSAETQVGRRFPVIFTYFPAHVVSAAKTCVGGNIRKGHIGMTYQLISSCTADMGKIFTWGHSRFRFESVSEVSHAYIIISRKLLYFYFVGIILLDIITRFIRKLFSGILSSISMTGDNYLVNCGNDLKNCAEFCINVTAVLKNIDHFFKSVTQPRNIFK